MPSNRTWRTAIAALSFVAATAATAAPTAQVFDRVAKPEAVDAQWRPTLCALLSKSCSAEELGLYRPRGSAEGEYVVLSVKPLAMARVQRTADGSWHLQRLHDFSAYQGTPSKLGGGREPQRSLAPALYPLANGRWAVAVQSAFSDMYSGGGASFVVADFVPLEGDPATAKPAYEDIPFWCSQMIRACFSEKEYKTSPHCHDETSGSLRIAYADAARPGAAHGWSFSWTESEWPAHKPRSARRSGTTRFTAADTSAVPFCGGPQ
ncbi:hypothetical protein SAMN05443579_10920 [Variovorax sp. PDC80]|uniref:hypothetical protein n=1 Tax=Variovorax sp. PDC80 TaxID=1882827 RepID=UPI0008E0FA21|nr:hypothetical protein [Variovorax sp. PDC80]SFP16676.1 hypothetical protein SAMN05443579_10920 [Variovorax sp. PDC80]